MSRATARGAASAAVLGLTLALAACGAPAQTGTPAPPPSATPPSTTQPPTAGPTAAPTIDVSPGLPTSVATTPDPSTAPPAGAVEDPTLIAVLPAEVAGHPVVLEPLAFDEAMADPQFASSIEAAAFGVVVSGDDLASAVVARPVAGSFGEGWFRDWRDSYNEGACGQSGGIAGNAEAEMGGRTVYIGTCAGGLRTYHAWLEDRGLLVSAFAVGEGRFGERLMAGLRP